MSRIGRKPIELPASVTFTNNNGTVTVSGPLGTLTREFPSKEITFTVEGNQILVTRANDKDTVRALHGLYRQLVENMVVGVTKGYQKQLNILIIMRCSKFYYKVFSHLVQLSSISYEAHSICRIQIKQYRHVT